jgi:hypothetical protein
MFVGGSGYDTPWRNAVYYDLIYQAWPVIYDYSGSALVYYLTYWLVPAGVCSLLGLSKHSANIVLFIWTFIGLRLFVSLLCSYVHVKKKQYLFVLLVFCLWSGLNSIGITIEAVAGLKAFYIDAEWGWNAWHFTGLTENGYAANYMIRTTFDSLANIYHQFVPMLLCTALFLKYRSVKSILFLIFLLIPFSPFGAIGLCLLGAVQILKQFARSQQKSITVLKNIGSPSNLLAGFTILPVFFLYFTTNNALEHTGSILSAPLAEYTIVRMTILLLYYLLYFVIFLDICRKHVSDKWLYGSVFISLLVLPFFKIGRAADFGWNASMPAFFIVMVFMLQELLRLFEKKQRGKRFWITLLIIAIAFTTPCFQLASQVKKCYVAKAFFVYVDTANIGDSFSNKQKDWVEQNLSDLRNFENPNYKDKIFYQYMAANKKNPI